MGIGRRIQQAPDSSEEQVAQYRRMARLARCRAINSRIQEFKDAYNSMALMWEIMADELQARESVKDPRVVTRELPGLHR
jgi:hypothetical protein